MRIRQLEGFRNAIGIAYKVDMFNANIIDKYIKDFSEGNVASKPSTAMLWAELSILNKPAVYSNYTKIINSEYTSNDAFRKLLLRNKANKQLNHIVEAQVERIAKNVDYTEKVLSSYEMPLKEYHKMLSEQKKGSVASRRKIMEDVLVQREQVMRSEGINIPNTFSYRNLDVMTQQLHMEAQSKAQHEEVLEMNHQAEVNGKSPVYTGKKWVWSHKINTRHRKMARYPVIPLDETFTVVNDKTGKADEMLYPRDADGSPSNVYGCACTVDYS